MVLILQCRPSIMLPEENESTKTSSQDKGSSLIHLYSCNGRKHKKKKTAKTYFACSISKENGLSSEDIRFLFFLFQGYCYCSV